MKKSFPKLKQPPIVEAIVDWNGMVPSSWKLEEQEENLKKSVPKEFSRHKKKFIQEANVHFPVDSPPELANSPSHSLYSHQFWNEKGTRLLQYRKNGFSFNMLPPYTTFEDEVPTMKLEWERFLQTTNGFELSEIRLRFINRIEIPITEDELDWDRYFLIENERVGVPLGFANQGRSHHTVWKDSKKNQVLGMILFLENLIPKSKANVIFDIECIQQDLKSIDAEWSRVDSILSELRQLKNEVFFGTVNERCLQLYQ